MTARTSHFELPAMSGEISARAALMNFVVYIDDPKLLDQVSEYATAIADEEPLKLVIVDATRAPRTEDRSSIHMNDHRTDLHIASLDPGISTNLVRQTLVRDMQTTVWWTSSEHTDNALFPLFARFSDMFIIDSSVTASGDRPLLRLAEHAQEMPYVCMKDLSWMRLAPWRSVIAGMFDHPSAIPELAHLNHLDMQAGSEAEMLYFASWLATRLGWSADTGLRRRFLDVDGHPIEMTLSKTGLPGIIQKITLRSDKASFLAQMAANAEAAHCTHMQGDQMVAQSCVPCHFDSPTHLIERALLLPEQDELFDAALRTICGLT